MRTLLLLAMLCGCGGEEDGADDAATWESVTFICRCDVTCDQGVAEVTATPCWPNAPSLHRDDYAARLLNAVWIADGDCDSCVAACSCVKTDAACDDDGTQVDNTPTCADVMARIR